MDRPQNGQVKSIANYTIKKITNVEDSAPKFGLDSVGEARFAKDELDAEATGVSYLSLKPGKRQPFGHRHDDAEEVYVVLAGSGRIKLDDDIEEISKLDAIRVSPKVVRAFEAGADGLEVLALGARHDGDGELLQGWWSD
jgi:mannose-6-phosphate isomerase-like protein (cupin superfamily)